MPRQAADLDVDPSVAAFLEVADEEQVLAWLDETDSLRCWSSKLQEFGEEDKGAIIAERRKLLDTITDLSAGRRLKQPVTTVLAATVQMKVCLGVRCSIHGRHDKYMLTNCPNSIQGSRSFRVEHWCLHRQAMACGPSKPGGSSSSGKVRFLCGSCVEH
jgi:hypothetical protein